MSDLQKVYSLLNCSTMYKSPSLLYQPPFYSLCNKGRFIEQCGLKAGVVQKEVMNVLSGNPYFCTTMCVPVSLIQIWSQSTKNVLSLSKLLRLIYNERSNLAARATLLVTGMTNQLRIIRPSHICTGYVSANPFHYTTRRCSYEKYHILTIS